MATSGTLNSGNYEGRYIQLTWSRTSYSVENNSSTIKWTLKGAGTASSSYYKAGNFKVVINGSTVYSTGQNDRIQLYNGTTVASGSITIYHNSDGTKSFSASIQAGIYKYAVNCKGSTTFTLDTIPRASSISSIGGSGSVLNGSNAITVNISRKSSSFTHKVTWSFGSNSYSNTGYGTSASLTIPLSWIGAFGNGGSGSKTGTVTVQTYSGSTAIGSAVSSSFTLVCPSASSISSLTSNIECNGSNSISVGISRSISSFTHTVTFGFGSYSKSNTGVGTSTSYAPPTSWLGAIPSANSGIGAVYVTTYYGSQQIGSTQSKTFTMTVPSYDPSFSGVSVEKVQPSNISSWDIFVQNLSNAKFTFNGASGEYSSSIKEYKIVINGSSYTNSSNVINTTSLPSAGTIDYTATVTDTRNKTKSITGSITVESFVAPSYVSSSIYRYNGTEKDDEGTKVLFNFKFSYKDYGGLNKTTNKIYIKESTSDIYDEYSSFNNDADLIIDGYTFDIAKSYDIKVIVTDTIGNKVQYDINIPTSYAIIDISDTGKGVGLLMMNNKDGYVQMAGIMSIENNGVVLDIGATNEYYAHYYTDAPNGHYFNTKLTVDGPIIAIGDFYDENNRRLAYVDEGYYYEDKNYDTNLKWIFSVGTEYKVKRYIKSGLSLKAGSNNITVDLSDMAFPIRVYGTITLKNGRYQIFPESCCDNITGFGISVRDITSTNVIIILGTGYIDSNAPDGNKSHIVIEYVANK